MLIAALPENSYFGARQRRSNNLVAFVTYFVNGPPISCFRCVILAIVLVLLCICTLWNKRRQLCSWNSSNGHHSEGDSAGSCYLPPQYSRCSSFHHAPPPYTEVLHETLYLSTLALDFLERSRFRVSSLVRLFIYFHQRRHRRLRFSHPMCRWDR